MKITLIAIAMIAQSTAANEAPEPEKPLLCDLFGLLCPYEEEDDGDFPPPPPPKGCWPRCSGGGGPVD